jgi:hypothetical protein
VLDGLVLDRFAEVRSMRHPNPPGFVDRTGTMA